MRVAWLTVALVACMPPARLEIIYCYGFGPTPTISLTVTTDQPVPGEDLKPDTAFQQPARPWIIG